MLHGWSYRSTVLILFVLSLSACIGDSGQAPLPVATPTTTPAPASIVISSRTQTPVTISPGSTVIPRPAASGASDAEALSWLHHHAAELTGLDGPMENYDPFYRVVGDARIVLFAQPTFGAHEPLLLQRQLLQHMVMQQGFTGLALEAPWGAVNLLNAYLQTGEGDPALILSDSDFLIWNNQELLYVVEWMRGYNKAAIHTSKLSIFGIDFQTFRLAFNFMQLSSYIRKVDAARLDFVDSHLRCFGPYVDDPAGYAQLPPDVTADCHDQLQQLYDDIESRQSPYEARSSASEFASMLHTVRITLQAEDYAANFHRPSAQALREQYLAENVRWIVEQGAPDMKLMVWTQMSHADLSADAPERISRLLRSQYGDALRVVGFSFYDGGFYGPFHSGEWPFVQRVSAPPAGSIEDAFHRGGLSRAVVDLRGIQPDSAIGTWFAAGHPLRGIGAAYDEAQPATYFSSTDLPRAFDALIYLDQVSPSDLRSPGVMVNTSELAVPTNLDFRSGMTGWFGPTVELSGCESGLDHAITHSGGASAYLKAVSSPPADRAMLYQGFSADAYRGKRVRLSAYLRTEQVIFGAGLLIKGGSIQDDSTQGHPVTETTGWTRYALVADVPPYAPFISIGLWLQGQGQVWMDDVRLEIVGSEVPLTYMQGAARQLQNGGFEQGFKSRLAANQRDYLFAIDSVVRHSGTASLSIRSTGAATDGGAALSQVLDPRDYAGKRVRLSGYIKANEVQHSAYLWIGLGGVNFPLDYFRRTSRAISGTTEWVKSEIVLDMPPDTNVAYIGVNLDGTGTIWLDDVQLEIVGADVPVTSS